MEEKVQTQEVRTVTHGPVPVATEHPQKTYETKKAIFRTYQIIWYILGVIDISLALRIALKALGANPLSGFTSFIYGFTDPFALPFQGIFRLSVSGVSVFEWSTIIAIVIYTLIAYGLVYLIKLIKPVTPGEVSETVDNT